MVTKMLADHAISGAMDCATVASLIGAKADPTYRSPSGRPSAVCYALYRGQLDVLRLMHSMWPDIDPPLPGYMSAIEMAIEVRKVPVLETLLELGFAYKHLRGKFEECSRPRGGRQIRWKQRYNQQRAAIAAVYTRFAAREECAQRAVVALLSREFRTRFALPRDVVRILGRMVWCTRRASVWEPREPLANRWHTMKLRHQQPKMNRK